MHRAASVGFLLLISLVACTHVKPSPPRPAPSAGSAAVPQAAATIPVSAPQPGQSPGPSVVPTPDVQPTSAGQAAHANEARAPIATVEPPLASTAARAPAKAGAASTVKAKSPSVDSAATIPAAAERSTAPANQAGAASTSQKPASSMALDLTSLEQRLRDTHAIGVFTKLSLKNHVDDLLGEFRTFHGGRIPPTLADLRQRYELLLLKVLTLLQDGDPPLAAAVAASRDAIWGILADREKFQRI